MTSNTEIIPGRTYLDNKGVELLYLGRGQYSRHDNGEGWQTRPNLYLYMKVKDINSKIKSGKLSSDLKVCNANHKSTTDFWRTVFFSENTRKITQCTGELYPVNYFNNLIVEDHTLELKYGIIYHWNIKAY